MKVWSKMDKGFIVLAIGLFIMKQLIPAAVIAVVLLIRKIIQTLRYQPDISYLGVSGKFDWRGRFIVDKPAVNSSSNAEPSTVELSGVEDATEDH